MRPGNIILTGFMATGKSAVGRRLAQILGRRFVDTDELIAARQGCSVAGIFRHHGETYFRKLEAEVARELAMAGGLVVATGGQLLLDPGNAEVLGRTGRIFCLTAEPEAILARVEADTEVRRPLLETEDRLARITALLKERAAGYARFEALDTTGRSPEEIARDIAARI
ncbi:MAG: shikimate kinase [Deltaproteobacteria bacterium]|nr:MAG: shikimate kinase [Deltaproteobacteria bacterium]